MKTQMRSLKYKCCSLTEDLIFQAAFVVGMLFMINLLVNAPILTFFFQNNVPKLKAWPLPHSLRLRDVLGAIGKVTPFF